MSLEKAVLRVYGALARAFPMEFQQACGGELVGAAEDMVRESALRGRANLLLLIPRLLGDQRPVDSGRRRPARLKLQRDGFARGRWSRRVASD